MAIQSHDVRTNWPLLGYALSAVLLAQAAPAQEAPRALPRCENYDAKENCARQRERARAQKSPRKAGEDEPEKVIIEGQVDPQDRAPRAATAQEKLERAWSERTYERGTIAHRNNDGSRVECDGTALEVRRRMGWLGYVLPGAACVSSASSTPGYLKPGY
jgi:hypothetical protein